MLIPSDPSVWLKELFIRSGLGYSFSSFLSAFTLVFTVIVISWLSNFITKFIIRKVVTRIVKRTTTTWDDIFLEKKVFTRLSHLAPALVIWFMAAWALKDYPLWLIFVHNLTYLYMVVAGTVVLISFIEAWHTIYNTLPISQHRHITGYVQVLKIVVIVISILIVISVVFKKDIRALVLGLGSMAAVLILIFKDTILGLVASIQLSANKMVSLGDWITVPGRNIDGIVADITLTTVKVQSFDKTSVYLPTYSLVNESFQNWKGMEESGVRQIKRSITIDIRSIHFLTGEIEEKLCRNSIMKEFINSHGQRGKNSTTGDDESDDPLFDQSRFTNLAVFRYYAEQYLRQHPLIDNGQTVMLRHRQPESQGLPLQVYAFTKNSLFVPYENIQSEIFEHLLAVIGEFGLRVFQEPSGKDFQTLAGNIK